MAKVITIANQKGGVGKTLTATCMATLLYEKKYRVLTISLDPQRNFDLVACDAKSGEKVAIKRLDIDTISMLHVLQGTASFNEAIVKTQMGDLARASSQLYQWSGEQIISKKQYEAVRDNYEELKKLLDDKILHGEENTKVLHNRLESIKDAYDYIIIDTNPSLTLLTLNSLYAADYVIIPAFSEETSIEAITELYDTIKSINYYNSWRNIKILGILMTKCNMRTNAYCHYVEYFQMLAERIGTRVFETKIRQSVRASEYIEYGQDLIHYDPSSKTTEDYRAFVAEFERIMNQEEALTNG